jgi:hypothetical protein
MNYAIAFDVELDRLVPESWTEESAIPKITCAAIFSEEKGTRLYYTKFNKNNNAAHLSVDDAAKLCDDLYAHLKRGALIISWGGTAVDFRALYHCLDGDQERQRKCALVTKGHIDIPIASSTDIGMMMGLDAAARGTGQGKKSNAISINAPRLWSEGKQNEVLEHVKLDAMLTLRVYNSMMQSIPPSLTWHTRTGNQRTWYCYFIADYERKIIRLSTVSECLLRPQKPVPFQTPSGMDRDKAVQWLQNLKSYSDIVKKIKQ